MTGGFSGGPVVASWWRELAAPQTPRAGQDVGVCSTVVKEGVFFSCFPVRPVHPICSHGHGGATRPRALAHPLAPPGTHGARRQAIEGALLARAPAVAGRCPPSDPVPDAASHPPRARPPSAAAAGGGRTGIGAAPAASRRAAWPAAAGGQAPWRPAAPSRLSAAASMSVPFPASLPSPVPAAVRLKGGGARWRPVPWQAPTVRGARQRGVAAIGGWGAGGKRGWRHTGAGGRGLGRVSRAALRCPWRTGGAEMRQRMAIVYSAAVGSPWS